MASPEGEQVVVRKGVGGKEVGAVVVEEMEAVGQEVVEREEGDMAVAALMAG